LEFALPADWRSLSRGFRRYREQPLAQPVDCKARLRGWRV
jgi:hypothetical protein